MTDSGFGSGPFGVGPFGRADVAEDTLWGIIPNTIKLDDALVGGDLEAYFSVVREMVDDSIDLAVDFPEQADPVTALSASESEVTLDVTSVEDIGGGIFRLEISDDDRGLVESMFPQSEEENGTPRADGWELATPGGDFYKIVRVASYDADASTKGLPTIDVRTNVSIGSTVNVRPPDLLTRLGSNVSVLVDKADPPDYTRRSIYRHRLVRDLKVSNRMFALVGRLVGFDVEARGLFCLSEAWYNALVSSGSTNVFDINGSYFADTPPAGHFFDQVPLDVMPLDTQADFDIYTVSASSVEEVSENTWCLSVVPVVDVLRVTQLGYYQFIDNDGDAHWIEEIEQEEFEDEVVGSTDGSTGPFALALTNIPVKPGSVEIVLEGLTATITLTDDGDGNLTGSGASGTIDYDSGVGSVSTVSSTSSDDIFATYTRVRVCVMSLTQPALGAGSIRVVAQFVCRADYKAAAAYRVTATPDEVLTEPGADTLRLVDRIEQKIDVHIPIHIRTLQKVISQVATLTSPVFDDVYAEDALNDVDSMSPLQGVLFDETALDAQDLDDGIHVLTATLTITP